MNIPSTSVSPLPAASKDVASSVFFNPKPPIAAPPTIDCVGCAPMVAIPSSLLESLVANTNCMTALLSDRKYKLHERSFDSFSPQANTNSKTYKRNQRRKLAKEKAKRNRDSTPTKTRPANTGAKHAKLSASKPQDPTPPRVPPSTPPAVSPGNESEKVFSSGLTSAKAWMKLRHPTGTPQLKPFSTETPSWSRHPLSQRRRPIKDVLLTEHPLLLLAGSA
jgi:hypothetical protein